MKKSTILLLGIIMIASSMSAQDWSRFGFKGKVKSSTTSYADKNGKASLFGTCLFIKFDKDGSLNGYKYYFEKDEFIECNFNFERGTRTMLLDNTYTLTFDSKNRLKEMSFSYKEPFWAGSWGKKVCYTYGTGNNPLTEIIYNRKYDLWYGYKWVRELSTRYAYLKYDEAGNWTLRKLISKGSLNQTEINYESRDIEYTNEYANYLAEKRDKKKWEKLQKEGDLAAIYDFASDDMTCQQYQTLAADSWNTKKWNEIKKESVNTNSDGSYFLKLKTFYFTKLTDDDHKIMAQDEMAKWLWKNKISYDNDFESVLNYKNYKFSPEKQDLTFSKNDEYTNVFDTSYMEKIQTRADSLKRIVFDSLMVRAVRENQNKSYEKAHQDIAKANELCTL